MTEPVVASKSPSVSWIESPELLDTSFIQDAALIPEKTQQAILYSAIESAVDRLFEFTKPNPWAVFNVYPGYFTGIRRLFGKKVLSAFDTSFSIEVIDNILESGEDEKEGEEAEKIYQMLYTLEHLNDLLEAIRLKMLACLKS